MSVRNIETVCEALKVLGIDPKNTFKVEIELDKITVWRYPIQGGRRVIADGYARIIRDHIHVVPHIASGGYSFAGRRNGDPVMPEGTESVQEAQR